MSTFLSGGILVADIAIGLFFLRYWRDTKDRFFLLFSAAFWLLGIERIPTQFFTFNEEAGGLIFLIRLLAFTLILIAVVEKNRSPRK